MNPQRTTFTEAQLTAISEAAAPLFEEAMAQGLHAPFALHIESWGPEYAEKLTAALTEDEDA